jgi:hypothetical protein
MGYLGIKPANSPLTSELIPDGIISTSDIADGAITTAKIGNGAVVAADLASDVYVAKAWVNFNGTGTVAIRASGNVSSITDNGTGDYTVNFTTTMVDANYTVTTESAPDNASTGAGAWVFGVFSASGSGPLLKTTTQVRMRTGALNGAQPDMFNAGVAIFR